jgi:Asp-tRNA(Asn)/Glu-tRNA(Gln) amidotransferase A subunit family amidase
MARDVAACVELLGLDVPDVSLPDLRLASAWGGVLGEPIEFPTARSVFPVFAREVGDVHRDLYPENAELYGENIRSKIEMCIGIGDAEYEAGLRARAEHRERAEAALDGFDLLVTPVLSCPIPPVDCDELEVRGAMTLYTFPFNALGWPALAVGNVQLVGRPGEDALVLAAGLALKA